MSYRISGPDEYLAVTGMGIKSVKITKAAWVWPLQRCVRFRWVAGPRPTPNSGSGSGVRGFPMTIPTSYN